MRTSLAALIFGIALSASCAAISAQPRDLVKAEDYQRVPMPPGFQVVATELEGPVFADARGRTLYMWPSRRMRNGYSGEAKGQPACYGEKRTTNAGLMSPYPPGLILPDLDTSLSCAEMWPPALAAAAAKPVGAWTVVARKDGVQQWAYDEHPLYTSHFDHQPGDVLGASSRRGSGETPAARVPVGPPPNLPPGFAIAPTARGRLLTTAKRSSVYVFDKDTATKSNCVEACAQTWLPVSAPDTAQPQSEWSIIERAPGVRQWAFRGKPLYTYLLDPGAVSNEGGDVPGWHNVYTQVVPPPPKAFTFQITDTGTVLADQRGMTIYVYNCGDNSQDQLACDHPDTTQAYRLAMCGGGDPVACVKNWPYVIAARDATSASRLWTTTDIDPTTGHHAKPGQPGALHVWAYRDRPVYTYAGDKFAGDTDGHGRGEFGGGRNGFQAFWVRDDFFRN